MDKVIKIILWIFMGAILVLIVTHSVGFSQAVSSVGGQVTNDASLLAGYDVSNTPNVSYGSLGPYITSNPNTRVIG